MNLHIERRHDGWWITGLPPCFEDCGAYATRTEAREARRGIERFFRDEYQDVSLNDTDEKGNEFSFRNENLTFTQTSLFEV
jgi:hypothetical protein